MSAWRNLVRYNIRVVSCDFCATTNPEINLKDLNSQLTSPLYFRVESHDSNFLSKRVEGTKISVENVYYMLMRSRIKLKHIAGNTVVVSVSTLMVTPCCDVTDSLVNRFKLVIQPSVRSVSQTRKIADNRLEWLGNGVWLHHLSKFIIRNPSGHRKISKISAVESAG